MNPDHPRRQRKYFGYISYVAALAGAERRAANCGSGRYRSGFLYLDRCLSGYSKTRTSIIRSSTMIFHSLHIRHFDAPERLIVQDHLSIDIADFIQKWVLRPILLKCQASSESMELVPASGSKGSILEKRHCTKTRNILESRGCSGILKLTD